MKKLILTVSVVILIALGFASWKVMGPSVHAPAGRYLYVSSDQDIKSVRDELTDQKIIKGAGWFKLVSGWLTYKTVRPGRYEIKEGMSIYNLVRMLRAGNQSPAKLVIVKERTKELFAGKVGKKYDLEMDSSQLITYLTNNDSLRRFGVDTNTVMAIIMPFTYEVYWNSSPGRIMQQFYTAYEKFWTPARKEKADSLGLSPLEVSTLASIVEEETTRKKDKYKIASTYLNRLKTGMKLQADPTVKFVTKNFQLGRIQGVHLRLESPYNTYLNPGLPPGPICTPSVESIDAVLDAPKTEYLFFVASHAFDGTTIFTKNYNDHLKYVALFHAEQKRRADSIKKVNAR